MNRCPIEHFPLNGACAYRVCPFHSQVNRSGCAYGEDLNVHSIAAHKGLSYSAVRNSLQQSEARIRWLVMLHDYAEWCKDGVPRASTRRIFKRLRVREPYTLPWMRWITVERLERMRNPEAFREYQQARGISLPQTVKEFVTGSHLEDSQ